MAQHYLLTIDDEACAPVTVRHIEGDTESIYFPFYKLGKKFRTAIKEYHKDEAETHSCE